MIDYGAISDERLVALVAKGEGEAFSCLMSRHMDMVYRVAFRHIGNNEEAEDISQEVFLRVWRGADSYVPSAKFTTWLYTITANMCKSQMRSLWRRHIKFAGTVAVHQDVPTPGPTPEESAIRKEASEKVQAAVNSLPGNQRLVLILKRYEGLSYAEIAKIMGCSVSAVESLLFRANTSLRKLL